MLSLNISCIGFDEKRIIQDMFYCIINTRGSFKCRIVDNMFNDIFQIHHNIYIEVEQLLHEY